MNIKKMNVGIIGMGYVGLPLAIEFSKKLNVIGFDIKKERIKQLNKGIDLTGEVSKKEILNSKRITFSTNILELKNCNIYIITVPTPINNKKKTKLNSNIKSDRISFKSNK